MARMHLLQRLWVSPGLMAIMCGLIAILCCWQHTATSIHQIESLLTDKQDALRTSLSKLQAEVADLQNRLYVFTLYENKTLEQHHSAIENLAHDFATCKDKSTEQGVIIQEEVHTIKKGITKLDKKVTLELDVLSSIIASWKLDNVTISLQRTLLQTFDIVRMFSRIFRTVARNSVTEVSLVDCGIDDAGIEVVVPYLRQLPHVSVLDLESNYIQSTGLALLADLYSTAHHGHLRELNLNNNLLQIGGQLEISKLLNTNPQLKGLKIAGAPFGSAVALELVNRDESTHLHKIDLSYTQLSPASFSLLAKSYAMTNTLIEFAIAGNALTSQELPDLQLLLARNGRLEVLSLADNRFHAGLGVIVSLAMQSNQALKHLNLCRTNMDNADFTALATTLASKSTLIHLLLCNNDKVWFSEEAVLRFQRALESNSKLEELNVGKFGGPRLGDALLSLGPSIRTLKLFDNAIGDTRFVRLATQVLINASRLVVLDVESNALTNSSVSAIVDVIRHTSLHELYLGFNSLRDGVVEIAAALGQHAELEALGLALLQMGDKRFVAIASMLELMPNLRILILGNNALTAASLQLLSQILPHLPALTKLHLASNSVQGLPRDKLEAMLKSLPRLRDLDLSEISLGTEGNQLLLPLLENRYLTSLRLGYNSISASGHQLLANIIKNNPYLAALTLSGNRELGPYMPDILASLENNFRLQYLGITSLGMGDHAMIEILRLLAKKSSLTGLKICRNTLTQAIHPALENVFTHNPHIESWCYHGMDVGTSFIDLVVAAKLSIPDFYFAAISYPRATIDKYLNYVAALPTLRNVFVSCSHPLSANILRDIAPVIKKHPEVEDVEICACKDSPEALDMFVTEGLQEVRRLGRISITNVTLHASTFRNLQTILSENPLLHSLRFSANSLTPALLPSLAGTLTKASGLVEIDLRCNHLGDNLGTMLKAALKDSWLVFSLDLSDTQLTSNACIYIADLIRSGVGLKTLNLNNNGPFSQDACNALISALQLQPLLRPPNLSNTGCTYSPPNKP